MDCTLQHRSRVAQAELGTAVMLGSPMCHHQAAEEFPCCWVLLKVLNGPRRADSLEFSR